VRSFTDLFVLRPVLAAVVSLLILLLGAISLTFLGVRETPDVQSPVVTVTTFWPGADPSIVESDVTEVLERQLNGIEGVRTISSTSQEQSSSITVEFVLERELEDAANDVRSRVSRARKDLPDDVDEPVVEKADANAQPVMFLRLAGDSTDLLGITEVADTLVRERLENVPGVSGVDLFGAQTYAMRVELDPVQIGRASCRERVS
jgi:multidrug efflux pump